ncbi:pilus assembly protein TadG-related protein [Mesorhizobium sp. B1-1-8]|uniref:pilus assembly protein TadG-related protein n=1 Tax=Mesorhizobium sp. B1-1-8 TaxID=2589976 RepID=UPI00112D9443|nr:pilus assembly protein TadG-related protein [Mesorhizobium sp. B1-1-8]UCI07302.1 pilus assembly protein TadG-related protein [Mesorhizobium sp. B1-1-8]
MLRIIRAFWRDQRGIALILVSVTLPAIIGFSLLAIDMSRVNNLHNDLQKAADAFALAGAAELDGSTGAWARAERAMATLVSNEGRFSTAAPNGRFTLTSGQPGGALRCNSAGNISWCFLKTIPNDDVAITTANYANADPAVGELETRFVQVTVTPTGFAAIFPVSFLSNTATGSFNVGAVAVAGFRSSVCDYTPVFMCNPYEDTSLTGGVTLEMAANQQQYRRRQILLRDNGFYQPGNFAFLASPEGNGAQALEASLARVKPVGCYAQDGVDTEPGQSTGPVQDGLNARFGISKSYIGSANGPAANVRMGLKSINCNNGQTNFETDPTKGVGLERDSCLIAGNCTLMGGRMGTGDWNASRYWAANHPTRGALPSSLVGATRYEMYRYELDPDGNPATNDSIAGDAAVSGETGNPSCNQTPVTTVDRRILYGAIIDCQAIGGFNGRANNIPVRAFGSFFITEPIKDSKDIYVELVDITGKGGRGTLDNFLRDEAQLYR